MYMVVTEFILVSALLRWRWRRPGE